MDHHDVQDGPCLMSGANMLIEVLLVSESTLLISIVCFPSGHIQKRGTLMVGGQQAFVRGAQYTTALCLTAPTVGGVNLKPLPPHLTSPNLSPKHHKHS